jgi:choice-of-anchor B domain-containing protein
MNKPLLALLLGGGLTVSFAVAPATGYVSEFEQQRAFGRAVAIAGDFAFVGEPNAGGAGGGRGGGRGAGGGAAPSGVVHVFRLQSGSWKKVDSLMSAAPSAGDGFGVALAADRDVLLVGQVRPAPAAGGGGGGGRAGGGGAAGGRGQPPVVPAGPPPADTSIGSVQIFKRDGSSWKRAGTLAGSVAGAQFGTSLAMSDNVVLVGAPAQSGGAVHVFQRANGAFTANGTLPAQNLAASDEFGTAVAVDGDRVAAGAPARRGKGAVFVFRRDSTGKWIQETEQVAPANVNDGADLGASVAVKGDRVIGGAPGVNFTQTAQPNPVRDSLLAALAVSTGALRDSAIARLTALAGGGGRGGRGAAGGGGGGGGRGGANIGLATGMVIAYNRASFGSWRMVGTLAPFDFGNVNFGASLQVVGDELWIGAPGSDGMGQIYRAKPDNFGGYSGMVKLGADSIEANAQWATAFAVSGNNAIVGMPGDGQGGGTVAFLAKDKGEWIVRNYAFPPVVDAQPAIVGKEMPCTDGKVLNWDCSNTSLMSYLPLSAIGSRGIGLSGSWGWTDPQTGEDIAIVGRQDGAAFVNVTDPLRPRYLGDITRTRGANTSSWREIKTYKNYALIVSDGSGDRHGIQIFDLTRLRGVKQPRRWTEDAHFDAGSIHDIAVNEKSGFAYAAGTANGGERCNGGLLMIDMKDPLKPQFAGCFADVGTGRSRGGYTHDVLCVNYDGPDKRFTGREICMASNETVLSIQDVTDKKNVKVLGHGTYPNVAYTHQGWFSEDKTHWYLNDELDEQGAVGLAAQGTRTMIFDVTSLTDPVLKKEFIGTTKATDHNLYVKGDRMYQSNYQAGLRIIDVSDPVNIKEVGFFDTVPGVNTSSFGGSWNNYPFFKNGMIGVSSGAQGFFVVKDNTKPKK